MMAKTPTFLHLKQTLKEDRLALLKKPYFLIYLPALLLHALKNRWRSPEDVLYLTETELSVSHQLMSRYLPEGYTIEWAWALPGIELLARQRAAEEHTGDAYLRKLASRFEQGDYALVLYGEGAPLAYLFISERRANFEQAHTQIKLPAGCFACYDVYTLTDCRGRGLYASLLAAAFQNMGNKGFKKMWLWVMEQNQLSVQVHFRLGIGHVVKVVSERYRAGFRLRSIKEVDYSLSELGIGRKGAAAES
ncbi:MAG: GNAT family N-acetyltransferase [Lewinellaceae bacterium]|nr:GNAT family N-acetyltransferase [Lewinellaceae bacterium]